MKSTTKIISARGSSQPNPRPHQGSRVGRVGCVDLAVWGMGYGVTDAPPPRSSRSGRGHRPPTLFHTGERILADRLGRVSARRPQGACHIYASKPHTSLSLDASRAADTGRCASCRLSSAASPLARRECGNPTARALWTSRLTGRLRRLHAVASSHPRRLHVARLADAGYVRDGGVRAFLAAPGAVARRSVARHSSCGGKICLGHQLGPRCELVGNGASNWRRLVDKTTAHRAPCSAGVISRRPPSSRRSESCGRTTSTPPCSQSFRSWAWSCERVTLSHGPPRARNQYACVL